jgi:hypothetical protein
MKCSNCDGIGTIEVTTCDNHNDKCCGNCYEEIMCDDCQGSGNYYPEYDEDDWDVHTENDF